MRTPSGRFGGSDACQYDGSQIGRDQVQVYQTYYSTRFNTGTKPGRSIARL